MKKLARFFVASAAAVMVSCSGGVGEIVGVSTHDGWTPVTPYGMNYIHMGSFTMGNNDNDVTFTHVQRAKTVSVPSFYIDDTEISNTEYRQFIWDVKDSIARSFLAEEGLESYYYEDEETGEISLNYDEYIQWDGEEEKEVLEQMFYDADERFFGKKQVDPRILNYEFYTIDYKAAASKAGRDNVMEFVTSKGTSDPVLSHNDRKQFVVRQIVNIYPDTLVWIHDFVGSYNDPYTENYSWHPAFDDYPLVGITWGQCNAFNVYRTRMLNEFKRSRGDLDMPSFRLPTETEWEYAARGGLELQPYPWGGPYPRNNLGCPLANFKPMRGDYVDDGGFYTVKVTQYEPNGYGLFNMSGNVAEWTSSAYDESVYELASELSTDYFYDAKRGELPAKKRKVIRGGSWKDVQYYLQVGTRNYEYQDTAKAYIGFRSIMSYLGRGKDPSAK